MRDNGLQPRTSSLAHKFRLQVHGAKTVDLARDVVSVTAVNKADAFYLRADLQRTRRALDLEVLDDRDRVTVFQDVSVGVKNHKLPGILGRGLIRSCQRDRLV